MQRMLLIGAVLLAVGLLLDKVFHAKVPEQAVETQINTTFQQPVITDEHQKLQFQSYARSLSVSGQAPTSSSTFKSHVSLLKVTPVHIPTSVPKQKYVYVKPIHVPTDRH